MLSVGNCLSPELSVCSLSQTFCSVFFFSLVLQWPCGLTLNHTFLLSKVLLTTRSIWQPLTRMICHDQWQPFLVVVRQVRFLLAPFAVCLFGCSRPILLSFLFCSCPSYCSCFDMLVSFWSEHYSFSILHFCLKHGIYPSQYLGGSKFFWAVI